MTKAELEAANWALAHSWHNDLGLVYAGVPLGDVATYSFLSVVGRIQLGAKLQFTRAATAGLDDLYVDEATQEAVVPDVN